MHRGQDPKPFLSSKLLTLLSLLPKMLSANPEPTVPGIAQTAPNRQIRARPEEIQPGGAGGVGGRPEVVGGQHVCDPEAEGSGGQCDGLFLGG